MKTKTNILLLIFLFVISACDNLDNKKYSGQVIARVNNEDITIHEFNYELKLLNYPAGTNVEKIKDKVLQRIINRRLLLQQAKKENLDRKPAVLQAILHSEHEIITNAYIKKLASSLAKPSDAKIKQLLREKPELYAKNAVFKFEQLTVSGDASLHTKLEYKLKSAKKLDEVIGWLKTENLPYRINQSIKTSDQLPETLLEKFYTMKIGEAAIFKQKKSLTILLLSGREITPLSKEQSKILASNRLYEQQIKKVLDNEIKHLRATASIKYIDKSVQ